MLGSARLWHPTERDGDLPHVRVHGEVVAPQAEHEHARDRLGANALEAAKGGLDGGVGLVAQVLEGALAALLLERLQDELDPLRLDLRQPARADRLDDRPGIGRAHLLPRRARYSTKNVIYLALKRF